MDKPDESGESGEVGDITWGEIIMDAALEVAAEYVCAILFFW